VTWNHGPRPPGAERRRTLPEILIAGLPSTLASRVAERLPKAEVRLLAPGSPPGDLVVSAENLVILDQRFASSETPALLAQLRLNSPRLPVIYCLDSKADPRLVRRLIIELCVSELFFYPLEPDAVARRAAELLGIPWEPNPGAWGGRRTAPDDPFDDALTSAWHSERSAMLESLDALDEAGASAQLALLDPERRQQAARGAHQLAVSLETLGAAEASGLASKIEQLLRTDSLTGEPSHRRFRDLVVALRFEIAKRSGPPAMPAACRLLTALIVGADVELAKRLAEEALARGCVWEQASDLTAARAALRSREPAAVLIDSGALPGADLLELLGEVAARNPPVPAMILTAGGSVADRVEMLERGSRGFIARAAPPDEIIDAAAMLAGGVASPPPTVLAVDDDPAVLEALRALITAAGTRFLGLSDPLRLWDALRGVRPDLLLLDIEMPGVSGIELCRVVRNDAQWAGVPVLFLTSHADAATLARAFAAGADDFVSKASVGLELMARINNRLERTRLARGPSETDPLTGLANGLKSRRVLQDFLRLADSRGQSLGLAVLGIDRLAEINRDHGTAAGDDVLRFLGRLLRHEFHGAEVAARWGGNQFVVGAYGLDRRATSHRLKAIAEGVTAQTFVGGIQADAAAQDFRVSLSAGVAAYPDDAGDLNDLYRHAGEALRRAWKTGGHRICLAMTRRRGAGPVLVDVAVITRDEALCTLLLHTLEEQGYGVRILRSAEIASRMLSGRDRVLQARAVVLDAGPPESDSLGLLQRLAADGVLNLTRVIMLTSPSVDLGPAKALAAGAADLVARPFDLPVLVDRVREALESSRR